MTLKKIFLFCTVLFIQNNFVLAEDNIKIGAMLHLTGEFPMQGKAFREGAELAVTEINEEGGMDGRKVELILEDSQYKPVVANLVGKKLLEVDQVQAAIIGTITEVMSVGPAFENAKVPLMVLWDSAPEIDDIGENIFAIGPWSPSTGDVAAKFAREKLAAKTAVIIGTNNPWPLSVSKIFREKFESMGGKVIQEIFAEPEEADFRSIITKAKSLKPDVLYCPVPNNLVTFFKQIDQVGEKFPVITGDNLTSSIINELGKSAEGVYQTQVADPDSEETLKFTKLYKAKYKVEPAMVLFSAWAYDAVKILAQTLASANLNSALATKKLYNIKNYVGASGSISINSKGSSPTLVKMFKVIKGKLEVTKD